MLECLTWLVTGASAAVSVIAWKPVERRFGVLSRHLEGRAFLLDAFSVADAYLLAVLNWCEYAGVDIAAWSVLATWRQAQRDRPAVARAMAAEMPLRSAA